MEHLNKQFYGPWSVVTGASSGIGKEFARQVAASGIHLVLAARRLPLLEALGAELQRAYGVQFRAVQADLSQPDFMERLISATNDLEIGLLISNAGNGLPGEFLNISEEILLNNIHLNGISHMRLAHHYGRRLADRGRGGILFVSAMGALDGIPYMSNDAATKAYVTSLGQGLHVEFAKAGVHTTVLIPGPTDTPVIERFGIDTASLPVKPMPVEQSVSEGLAALKENRATHLSGRLFRIMNRVVPSSITRRMNSKMLAQAALNNAAKAV